MPSSQPPACPKCKKPMTLSLPPNGRGERAWRCPDCDRPDPMQSEEAQGWLKGELGKEA
jgi:hypothetical protein